MRDDEQPAEAVGRSGAARERTALAIRGVPHIDDLRRALEAPRVVAALHQTLRDLGLRGAFRRLRGEGHSVSAAVNALRGPHHDVEGRPYFLSTERVRSIVYEKSAGVSAEEPCEPDGGG
jgi:hypothetical protein